MQVDTDLDVLKKLKNELNLPEMSIDIIMVPSIADDGDKKNSKKLRVSALICDAFLLNIPAVFLIGQQIKNDNVEISLVSYKGSVLKSYVTSSKDAVAQIETLANEMTRYSACIGLNSQTKTYFQRAAYTEVFNQQLVDRHPDCCFAVTTSLPRCVKCSGQIATKRCRVKTVKALAAVEYSEGPKDSTLACDSCDVEFKSRALLKQHIRRKHHTEKKVWTCTNDGCGRTFARSDGLKTHQSMHLGQKDFVCEQCEASFTRKGTLTEHTRRAHSHVSDTKSWSCADCDKTFFCRQQLERHRRIHVGDRPHRCQHCIKSFSRSHHLSRHVEKLHGPAAGCVDDGSRQRQTLRSATTKLEYSIVSHDGVVQKIVQIIPLHN